MICISFSVHVKFTDTCTTCNNEENQSKRMETKELIARLKKVNPYVEGNISRVWRT